MNWIYTQENRIYTIIQKRTTKSIGTKYKNLFFTQDPEPDDTSSHFPTVYMHFLPTMERGQTIDANGINAITSTVQIEVTSSKTQGQTVAREVIWEVIDQLHKLKFEVAMSPEVVKTGNDTSQCVARMRRMIGASDTIG